MNDNARQEGRKAPVRPRDAAALILLRGEGRDLEVLLGRRLPHLRFMPGVYVFPGGAIDREDRLPWTVETAGEALPARLLGAARAALRETWEETGVLIGRPAAPAAARVDRTAIERAYRASMLAAAMDLLSYVGRAITPSFSGRRFNTRFFLVEGEHGFGEPTASAELEDVAWHPIGRRPPEPLREVTRFMLSQALAVRAGTARGHPPLFYWAKNVRRIGICREGLEPSAARRRRKV
jgi:8-oxo-dGTP pyrophosphatase MutT (NUDIX family)